ncbi:MAG: ABC transporter permease subunit [Candidatus Hodarchaeales archaeon]
MALRELLLKRIGQAILTIFVVLVIDFAIFNLLPGSYIDLISQSPNVSPEALQIMIESFGLNKPLAEQFLIFFLNFVQGNLGYSLWSGEAVLPLIIERLINTLILLLPADIIAITLGIWIGKQSAWRRGSFLDLFGWSLSLITYAIPTFWLGLTFLSIFGINLGWFPVDIYNFMKSISDFEGAPPLEFVEYTILHLAMPLMVLIIAITGVFALIMRNSLLETLSEDYMVTAKAKGRKDQDQLNKEAYPNARIPVATVVAIQIGFSVVGALLIEIVFNYNGIGRLIWNAVGRRDYVVLQGAFFMFTAVLIITNLVADFVYFYLDPRIRVAGPEIKQAKDIQDSNRTLTYSLLLILGVIIALIFIVFETDRVVAFTLLNGIMWFIALSHKLLKDNFEIELPNPLVLIILSITFSAVFLFEENLDFVILYTMISLAVIIIIKWQILLHSTQNFLKKYKITNLIYSWNSNKVQTITNVSLLLIILYSLLFLTAFFLDFISNILNQIFGIVYTPYFSLLLELDPILGNIPSIMLFAAFTGLIAGMIVSNSANISSVLDQVLETNKGVFGLILIISFLLLAIFGDVLAPFDPQKSGIGSPFQSPSTVLEYQFILFILSISVFLFMTFLNSIKKFKNTNQIGSGIGILLSVLFLGFFFILIVDFIIDLILKVGILDSSVYTDFFIMVIYEAIIGISIISIINSYKTKSLDSFLKIRTNYIKIIIFGLIMTIILNFLIEMIMKYLDLLDFLLKISYIAAFAIISISILFLLIMGSICTIFISLRILKRSQTIEDSLKVLELPSEVKLFSVGTLLLYLSLILTNLSITRVGTPALLYSIVVLYSIGFLMAITYLVFIRIQNSDAQDNRLSMMKYFTVLLFVIFIFLMMFTFFSFDGDDYPILFSILLTLLSGIILIQGFKLLLRDFNVSNYKVVSLKIFNLALITFGGILLITTGYSIILTILDAANTQPLFLLGTSKLGKDMFSQLIIGVRITLLIALLATLISVIIGTSIGLVSGYYGGLVDSLLMRFTDIFFVIPAFVLMIIVVAIVGPSIEMMLIVIGIFSWAVTARIVRAQTLSIKERPYVERVRSIGGSDTYIMIRHILPSILPIIIAQTVLLIINSIFFELGLDFVGLGDPNQTSWGSMLFIASEQSAITLNFYWMIYPPGIAVIILLLGFAFFGFSLDEVTNPKLRRR